MLISGRDTDQLAERVPLKSIRLIGNHGAEESFMGRSRLTPAAQAVSQNLSRVADAVADLPEAALPGVRIEAKRASLSVHFRESQDRSVGERLQLALGGVAEREGLQLHAGRFVWELRPAIDVNKGSVVRQLAETAGIAALIYVGDDVTDADAFRALSELKSIRTLGVGVVSSEVPASVFKDCDLLVEGVEGVKGFLSDLLAVG